MALVKWNPGFATNIDRIFEDFFNTSFPDLSVTNYTEEGTTLPAVNIKETDREFVLEIAAPGMNKKDFHVFVENGVLNIRAEKEIKDEKKEEGYTRKEFSYQSFQRAFTLPDNAKADNISAEYKNGILYVTLPKKAETKPQIARTIKIS